MASSEHNPETHTEYLAHCLSYQPVIDAPSQPNPNTDSIEIQVRRRKQLARQLTLLPVTPDNIDPDDVVMIIERQMDSLFPYEHVREVRDHTIVTQRPNGQTFRHEWQPDGWYRTERDNSPRTSPTYRVALARELNIEFVAP